MSTQLCRKIVTALLLIAPGVAAIASPFHVVKDIYPGSNDGTSAYLVADDANVFFWGYDGVTGTAGEPWLSDGTASGTNIIATPVGSTGHFSVAQQKMAYQGIAYFVIDAGFGDGNEFWRTDGTAPGTFRLAAVGNSVQNNDMTSTPVGNYVVFGNLGDRPMSTDGTVANTHTLSATCGLGSRGVAIDGATLFLGGNHLIITDGTLAGTTCVAVPGLVDLGTDQDGQDLAPIAAVNEVVYFAGKDATNGTELWKTDGSVSGTVIVKDLAPGTTSSNPQLLTRVDDRLFFVAKTPDAGEELWTSDGTDAGTVRVKDIHPGNLDSNPQQLTALNGILYFTADDGTHGRELWSSDGTDAGTVLALGDANPQGNVGAFDFPSAVQTINHKLLLKMDAPGFFGALQVSDGTLSGTQSLDPKVSYVQAYQNTFSGNDTSALVAADGKLFVAGEIQSSPTFIGVELLAADSFASLGNTWCANPERPIPDEDGTDPFMTSRSHLPNYGGITKLTVSVDIGHTYVGDLQIKLRHEQTATEVVLLDRPNLAGNCSGALLDIVLDDSAATGAQDTCANTRPSYPRDQSLSPLNPLSAFNGQSLKGDWTMTVTDKAGGDTGVLHEWCMNFTSDLIFTDSFD